MAPRRAAKNSALEAKTSALEEKVAALGATFTALEAKLTTAAPSARGGENPCTSSEPFLGS